MSNERERTYAAELGCYEGSEEYDHVVQYVRESRARRRMLPSTYLLAMARILFDDMLIEEATRLAEGREDRVCSILDTMWCCEGTGGRYDERKEAIKKAVHVQRVRLLQLRSGQIPPSSVSVMHTWISDRSDDFYSWARTHYIASQKDVESCDDQKDK